MYDAENNEPMPETPFDVPDDARSLRRAFFLASGFAAFLWLIALTDLLLDLNLTNASFAARISDHYPLWVEFNTLA